MGGRVEQLKEKVESMQSTAPPEKFQGDVRWVNQHQRVVWISLGRADSLQPRTTFSVYAAGTDQMTEVGKKASIEVTEVLGDHLAEAKILDDQTANPIVPGDRIFTPVWSLGEKRHFAIAGLIDLNGDGRFEPAELQRLCTLIEMNGGVVDAPLDAEGKRRGKMTLDTRYLIEGKDPGRLLAGRADRGFQRDDRRRQEAAGGIDFAGEVPRSDGLESAVPGPQLQRRREYARPRRRGDRRLRRQDQRSLQAASAPAQQRRKHVLNDVFRPLPLGEGRGEGAVCGSQESGDESPHSKTPANSRDRSDVDPCPLLPQRRAQVRRLQSLRFEEDPRGIGQSLVPAHLPQRPAVPPRQAVRLAEFPEESPRAVARRDRARRSEYHDHAAIPATASTITAAEQQPLLAAERGRLSGRRPTLSK